LLSGTVLGKDISSGSQLGGKTMSTRGTPDLDAMDDQVRRIEALFFDGVVTVQKIEKVFTTEQVKDRLELARTSEMAKANIDRINASLPPSLRSFSSSNSPTVSEKKDFYLKAFAEYVAIIADVKTALQGQSGNSVSSLLERCEKCEQAIRKSQDAVRNF